VRKKTGLRISGKENRLHWFPAGDQPVKNGDMSRAGPVINGSKRIRVGGGKTVFFHFLPLNVIRAGNAGSIAGRESAVTIGISPSGSVHRSGVSLDKGGYNYIHKKQSTILSSASRDNPSGQSPPPQVRIPSSLRRVKKPGRGSPTGFVKQDDEV
jgi:hypothetical protein